MAKEFYISNKSNRSLQVVDGRPVSENDIDASYDERGNLLKLSGTQNLQWNYRDNIAYVDIITRPSGKNDSEYYVYDSSGQRVRKVTETYQNNEINSTRVEKIYFGDLEVTRTYQGNNLSKEKYTLHVADDKSRVALHHYWTKGSPEDVEIKSQDRYQLSNHLDSVALELNDNAEIMSYEEYLPFGGTALIAGKTTREVTEKEYRYSGKERDDSTGLYYYGARYYAPWLFRWINPDPAGTVDGPNLYLFIGGNPANSVDIGGRMEEDRVDYRKPRSFSSSTEINWRGREKSTLRRTRGKNIAVLSGSRNEEKVAVYRAEANPNQRLDVSGVIEKKSKKGKEPMLFISIGGDPQRTEQFAEKSRAQAMYRQTKKVIKNEKEENIKKEKKREICAIIKMLKEIREKPVGLMEQYLDLFFSGDSKSLESSFIDKALDHSLRYSFEDFSKHINNSLKHSLNHVIFDGNGQTIRSSAIPSGLARQLIVLSTPEKAKYTQNEQKENEKMGLTQDIKNVDTEFHNQFGIAGSPLQKLKKAVGESGIKEGLTYGGRRRSAPNIHYFHRVI